MVEDRRAALAKPRSPPSLRAKRHVAVVVSAERIVRIVISKHPSAPAATTHKVLFERPEAFANVNTRDDLAAIEAQRMRRADR